MTLEEKGLTKVALRTFSRLKYSQNALHELNSTQYKLWNRTQQSKELFKHPQRGGVFSHW